LAELLQELFAQSPYVIQIKAVEEVMSAAQTSGLRPVTIESFLGQTG
jgi:hypothetical protein